jgi:hypothetical protein
MPRNVLSNVDHGPDDSRADHITETPQTSSAPTRMDEAYWRAHPDEFMQSLLAATGEAFEPN